MADEFDYDETESKIAKLREEANTLEEAVKAHRHKVAVRKLSPETIEEARRRGVDPVQWDRLQKKYNPKHSK